MRGIRNWRGCLAVLAAAAGIWTPGRAVAFGPPGFLAAEHLTEAGLHLPSYMPTVEALMAYQERLPFHQTLEVRWDARPGMRDLTPAEEADRIPLSPNFTLLKRGANLPGAVGKSQRPVGPSTVIVVAVDSAKQVRGLTIQPESLEVWGEDLRVGQQKSWRYARPRVTLNIRLPDDPQIQTVLFFNPIVTGADGRWKLQQVGSLPLPQPKGPTGQ